MAYTDTAPKRLDSDNNLLFKIAQVLNSGGGSIVDDEFVGPEITDLMPDATGVTLGWTDNSSNEDGFRVQYNFDGSGWNDVDNSGEAGDTNPTAANDISFLALLAAVTGAGTQKDFCADKFRVRAENAFGNSAWSAELQVAPSVEILDLDAVITLGVQVELLLTPTQETGGNSLLHVWRSINGGAYTDIGTGSGVDGSYVDDSGAVVTALGLLQAVLYKVRNQNDGGNGPYSNVATAHL